MKKIRLNKILFMLCMLQGLFAFSQKKQISGKVLDETSQPIIGVSVFAVGTSTGTTTDIDGNYKISVPGSATTLRFSYLGYQTLDKAIGEQSTINIILKESSAQLDEIIITGFRGAEQRAIAVKRKAASIVEAITPEDIGNYSDENIADALQRVPGLQVERDDSGNGGGDRVSVRGVGPQFVKITVNGRTPLSAGNEGIDGLRQFNLDVLPTEVVGGAMVYKSSEAHLVEPGLGGAVDFQTIKPLSLRYGDKNHYLAINARGDVNDYGDNSAFRPRVSAIFGIKSKNEKVGFMLSSITSNSKRAFDSYNMGYLSRNINEDTDGDGTADISHTGVLSPGLTRYNPVRNTVDRSGISAAFQWKINEKLELNADVLYTSFDNRSTRNQFRLFPQLETNNVTFPSADLNIDENNVLRGFNTQNSSNPVARTANVPTQYDNFQTSFMTGLNLKWEKDNWKITGDLSLSNIDFDQRLTLTQSWFNVPSLSYDGTGDLAVFNFDQAASTDIANANPRDYAFLRDIMLKGNNHAVRIDFENTINDKLKLRFGGRYSATNLDSRQAQLAGAGQSWEANYLDPEYYYNTYVTGVSSSDFAAGRNIGNNSFLMINQELLRANNPDVFNRTAGSSFEGDLFSVTNGDLPLLTQNSWDLDEKTTSVYGQLDFKSKFAGVPVSGNVGVRAVNWQVEGRAFSTITLTDPSDTIGPENFAGVPTTSSSSRWDVLPSLNLNFALKDNFNLRFSAVNTVSRPDYLDLRPTNTLSYINPDSPDAGSQNGTATLSNTNLKPFSSWQFDATGEWYNKAGGAFVLSGFYKLINDFIIDETTFGSQLSDFGDVNFDASPSGLDGQLFDATTPVNFTGVQLYGFEAGFRQPFSFIGDAFRNFGVQANYTYVDSKFDEEINDIDNSFPGSSKHNLNSVLYYDGSVFGVRVAYNTRSSFLRNIGGGSDIRSNVTYTDGFDRLDIRANYEVTKKLQLSASVQNLTASDRRDYINNDPSLFTQLTRQGAVYTVGARYKL
ncbi:TonB-dependent receptor [Polaribacter vadi]|uniref:TonB-dependent receptor n=1 Tax=Polaribacter TaxID=52959 RepID=UPI001C098635|nr:MULTISPECIES: TonB-dependent receptor [Polaribacter]MBU3012076.1 TonB-dependent receptor [Polaribacter vadi]MDO6741891.1 TonB-dependent receptor [Polaribacter sp. 1_MG-2023]